MGPDEFIVLGLIALAYGVTLLCHAYGFLAVFAAGLALRRVAAQPVAEVAPWLVEDAEPVKKQQRAKDDGQAPERSTETPPIEELPTYLMKSVERFNAQLGRLAEVAVVLVVGALLTVVDFGAEVLWFVPLLLFVIRPLSVYAGLVGVRMQRSQRRLIAWFGIRGIGSVYYLMYAITHDLEPVIAQRLLAITLAVVVMSMLLHGVSVTPLMRRYEKRKEEKSVVNE